MPTPQRLPIVNNDDGVWGDIIRQYIAKEHYNDDTDNSINGSHKTVTIRPGTATAGTAPLKFSSGTLLSSPEAGAVEFNTDSLYLTTTTGTVRKKVAIYDDSSGATGDIYYRDSGGSFVRLPAGADGKILSISSGLPAWGDVDLSSKVSKSGDTMTGALTMGAATANRIFYGTTGVAAPGSNSNGEKIQLYGTAGTVNSTDYALGIESGNLWLNSGGGYKFYYSSTLRMTLDSSGQLGIGVTPTASNGYLQLPAGTTLATGGIAWGTDTNLYRSAANTLKTDDAFIVPRHDSLSIASLTNTSYTMTYNTSGSYPSFSPVPKYLWHDMLTYQLWWGTPTYETYDGTWSAQSLNKALFSNKEAQAITLVNGTSVTGARWTWNNANIAYSFAVWWVLGIAYHGATPSSKDITIETSTDGSSWTTRHTTTGNTSHYTPVWLFATEWSSETYVRLTIMVTNSQPLCMSSIKALSGRWGNQGSGSEYNLPYTWDSDGRITVGTGTGGIAGTTNYSNGALNVGSSTATTAAQGIYFGTDTNLYRSAANVLQTNDSLYVDGNLVVGTGSVSASQTIRGSSYNGLSVDIYSDTASAYNYFRRARGTYASPTYTTSGSFLGSFGFRGHTGSAFVNQDAARFSAVAAEDYNGGTHSGYLTFNTAAIGTSTASGSSERMRIDPSGNIRIGSSATISSKLTFDAATTAAGGILFGSDTNLYRSAADSLKTDDAFTAASLSTSGNITVTGTVDGRDIATDGAKLDTIAANADVTDTASVTSAGALMDSELTDLAGVKALDTSTLATLAGTQTLTNKRVTVRTGTTASSATPTINTDNVDAYHLTAQAVDITSFTTNLSGTPTDFQKLIISITGTAARAITWGSSFENGVVALPTTTTSTERLDVGFIWNAVTSKWRCMASGSA